MGLGTSFLHGKLSGHCWNDHSCRNLTALLTNKYTSLQVGPAIKGPLKDPCFRKCKAGSRECRGTLPSSWGLPCLTIPCCRYFVGGELDMAVPEINMEPQKGAVQRQIAVDETIPASRISSKLLQFLEFWPIGSCRVLYHQQYISPLINPSLPGRWQSSDLGVYIGDLGACSLTKAQSRDHCLLCLPEIERSYRGLAKWPPI